MEITLPLAEMTTAEKLRVMEALWADLSQREGDIESPAWHAEVLREREERVKRGEESYLDWETVKRHLRERHR